jgi:predicted site-specific integrase-resolvase
VLGFGYLVQAFGWRGVRDAEVLEPPQVQEPIQDMLTIVTVFTERLYGQRATGLRKRVEATLKECEQADGTGNTHHQTPT